MLFRSEGGRYRVKTRFSKFHNLPELTNLFREIADIQTADMLNLDVPKAVFHNEVLPSSEIQKQFMQSFMERADRIRSGGVDSSMDNMRKRCVTATNHEENVTKAVADIRF